MIFYGGSESSMNDSSQTSRVQTGRLGAWILVLFAALVVLASPPAGAKDAERLMVGVGQTKILDFPSPVKRVSLANPDIADATVTSPRQLIVNGKAIGATTMIVWDEKEKYTYYKLVVHSENTYNQVMLKVRIAEVDRSAFREFGVDFLAKNIEVEDELLDVGGFAGQVHTPHDPLLLGDNVDFFLAVPTQDISTIIRAMEEKRRLTMLARPNLTAINGSEATFLAGGEIPVPVVSGATDRVTVEYKPFGIRLSFVPTVLDSELVNIKVATEVSSLDFDNGIILSGFRIPALVSNKAETTVEIRDGELFVIGGLVSSELARSTAGLPLLSRIPVLGYLFGSHRFQSNESELLIMISPHIVQAMQRDAVPAIRSGG
jgi:pilus assembly protein CpaC